MAGVFQGEPMGGADYAGVFARDAAASPPAADMLQLPHWSLHDWSTLLAGTTVIPFRTSDVVISRGAEDRALYFIAAGMLEVGVTTFDGVSVASLARIGERSIIGEQSFFDGQPRSANVWAVSEGTLLRWELEQFKQFGLEQPGLARDLLFAVGRILSTRLRMTTTRVRR